MIRMEWTKTDHLPSLLLQTDVFTDHVDYVVSLLHTPDLSVVETPWHKS